MGREEEFPPEVLYIDKILTTFSVLTCDNVRDVGSHILGDLGLTALQRAVVPCEVGVRMAL